MAETGSIIAALGAGSGINMAQLASDLAEAQFALRSDRLTARTADLEQKISVASSLKNSLSLLASSLGDRVRIGDLSAQPGIADGNIAEVSLPFGSRGQGSYSLEVTQLARGQSLASATFGSADDVVGAGTLTLRFGTVSGTAFTEDTAHPAVDIAIDSGSTLTAIAAAISASGAGVTAYVAQTSSGARLMIKGEDGAASGFVLEATETPGEEGLAALAWEPSAGDPARLTQSAQNALFKLDGLDRTATSNNVGTVAPGLSLRLKAENPGAPTQISFNDPSEGIAAAMQDLVSAFNEVAGSLKLATDPQVGDLRGDPGARALRSEFGRLSGRIIMPNAAGDAPRTLSDLGLATERDGTFRLDTARLQATLERDPDGVAAMFTSGLYGIFATVDALSRNASLGSNPGSIGGSIARYERLSREQTEDLSDLAEKQENLRASLLSRFAKADTRITASQSTLTFLKAQIDAWNGADN